MAEIGVCEELERAAAGAALEVVLDHIGGPLGLE
jgi:hypothetical protein